GAGRKGGGGSREEAPLAGAVALRNDTQLLRTGKGRSSGPPSPSLRRGTLLRQPRIQRLGSRGSVFTTGAAVARQRSTPVRFATFDSLPEAAGAGVRRQQDIAGQCCHGGYRPAEVRKIARVRAESERRCAHRAEAVGVDHVETVLAFARHPGPRSAARRMP